MMKGGNQCTVAVYYEHHSYCSIVETPDRQCRILMTADSTLARLVNRATADLDLNLVEDLAIVDAHNTSNHLWYNNHVP